MRNFFKISTILLVLGLMAGFADFYRFYFSSLPIRNGDFVDYTVRPGATIKVIAHELWGMGVLSHYRDRWYLEIGSKWNGQADYLKAGEYRIVANMTIPDLLDQIVAGRVLYHSITFIEGWTFNQVLAEISKNPFIKHELDNKSLEEVRMLVGFSQPHPEGLIYPETYHFIKGYSDIALLRWAHHSLEDVLQKEWQERADNLPYQTPYQALIVASLIEKETSLTVEKPIVSGVIMRRLQKRMRLQIDPTVIYGLGEKYSGKLKKSDLLSDSPYNTYKRYGLPPSPIALADYQSIHAALHPDDSDYLYFVASGDGSHIFSSTLDQHNNAVQRFITAPKNQT